MYSYNGFKVGELIIYTDGETYEIGRIKRLTADGAFVCFSRQREFSKQTTLVEGQGMSIWTRVRFPSTPLQRVLTNTCP